MNKSRLYANWDKNAFEKRIIADLLRWHEHPPEYYIKLLGRNYGERCLLAFQPVLDALIIDCQKQLIKAQKIKKHSFSQREKVLMILKIMRMEDKIEACHELKVKFANEHALLYDKIVMKKHP